MDLKNPWGVFAMISGMGMEIVILTVGGGYLGNKLDHVWNTGSILLFTGIFLGLGTGFVSAAYTLKVLSKDSWRSP